LGVKPGDYNITVQNVSCPVKELTTWYLKCDLTKAIEKHSLLESNPVLDITVCIYEKSKNRKPETNM
jgi:hypothetical protein